MNTRPNLLMRIIALILPLAALASSGIGAQTNNEAMTKGQAIIRHKLDDIRFVTVGPWDGGLPLSEVVRRLSGEVKKLDPAKSGVNFILNPNPPMEANTPDEVVDINSVIVRIPLLDDVSLADVLNLVVRVADHPIRYSIEDYGVVFALGRPVPPPPQENLFAFPGGTPRQFLEAVQQQCNVNWSSLAEIPPEMENVRVPKLRINRDSLGPILKESPPGRSGNGPAAGGSGPSPSTAPLRALVALYNDLGARKPELGHLIVEGSLGNPAAVMFIGGASGPAAEIKVKAFPIKSIPEKDWGALGHDIAMARDEAGAYSKQRGASETLQGHSSINRGTKLLIATGSGSYIEMVESIVAAYTANEGVPGGVAVPPQAK